MHLWDLSAVFCYLSLAAFTNFIEKMIKKVLPVNGLQHVQGKLEQSDC